MAIIKEFYKTREDGINLYRTYSDENKMIIEEVSGAIYDEAIDVEDANFVYIESSEYVAIEDIDIETIEKAKAYDILIGEAE